MSALRKLINSTAAATLILGGLAVAPLPAHSATQVTISEIAYAGDNSSDYLELHADPGSDLSGWAIGTVTRGGTPNAATGYVVTVPGGTTVPPSGYWAIDLPITNSVSAGSQADGSYGSSALLIDSAGQLIDFKQIGGTVGGLGVTGGSTAPAAVRGVRATPTGAAAPAGQSIQVIEGAWTAAPLTKGAANEVIDDPTITDPPTTSPPTSTEPTSTEPTSTGSTPTEPTPTVPPSTETSTTTETSAETTPTGPVVTPLPDDYQSIPEIQTPRPDSDASALAGSTVSTRGVVTAVYPTGGLNGYAIQTPGTGGVVDPAARTTSDGLFVFSASTAGSVSVGDYLQVRGAISEFNGLTEVTITDPAAVIKLADEHPAVAASTTAAWPTSNTARETLESMLYLPTGNYTVSNTFSTNQFGEVGLAFGSTPLIQPTEKALPGSPAATAIVADNAARAVALDDGASTNFLSAANSGLTPPYISLTAPVRVGETATFSAPVMLDYRNGAWKFQPIAVVTQDPATAPVSFSNTRTSTPDNAAIGGDLKVASFNVLNYFTTLGADGPSCTAFNDRTGDPVTVNSGCEQRGAWDPADLQRQQDKIVAAINALDADVVGLMEIENSAVVDGVDHRDEAVGTLVAALNAAAGGEVWAFVPSSTELPPLTEMDVISNAIIYKPAAVARTGESRALGTASAAGGAFDNAREPLAQVFAPTDGGVPFLFSVNHFKSKGSAGPWPGDKDTGDGQGASNESRSRQAEALRDWIESIKGDVQSVVLAGDFNSYSQEDPLRKLYDAGFVDAGSRFDPNKYSYSFSGLSGSLDHVLLSGPAAARATGADTWNINSGESIALEYSRYNYHGTLFYAPDPYRSSDHDPVVVGLRRAATDVVQILGINDFHGRIKSNGVEAGAAVLAGAVKQLRTQHPDTVFAAAGDLIGASTFESFIADDKPTIDALNAAGLQVSAVGNHEFDQGYDDLVNRVMKPYDAATNPTGGASWRYLGANVRNSDDGSAALPESWVQNFGDLQVGFVGAVTDHLPELVSPAGIEGLTIEAPVAAANRVANSMKEDGVDVVVLLVHEGAATTNISSATDPASDMGRIVNGASENIDAIISGHTHLAYNHAIPVQQWISEGRAVTERPVVSAGQYGYNLNQLLFSVDPATGDLQKVQQEIVPLTTSTGTPPVIAPSFPADPATQAIADKAVADAAVLGAVPLGQISGPFNRAKLSNGSTENRGGESTLGNLVAEVQKSATSNPESGSAAIAFMNPGGLRQDMIGNNANGYPAELTYQQAAVVQPFANTLVNMTLTGAQLKTVLEQQWQPAGSARAFLRLGISQGFTYTYDPAAAGGSHITGIRLKDEVVEDATEYSVTVNSFLASGGDNFFELANGANKRDTGQTDLQAMVDYLADNISVAPDFTQRSVGVSFPADAPVEYASGDTVAFSLSSLAFSTGPDAKDSDVIIIGDSELGTFPVDNTVGTDPFDEYGKATVSFPLPAGLASGTQELTVTGNSTKTSSTIPITVAVSTPTTTVTLTPPTSTQVYGSPTTATLTATVSSSSGAQATGTVDFVSGAAVLGSQPLSGGKATFRLPSSTPAGTLSVVARYSASDGSAVESAPVQVVVESASSRTILLTTRTSYRQNPLLPAILIGAVALNNGQRASGSLELISNGQVLAKVPLSSGVSIYVLPRSLPRGTYQITAQFVPTDSTNITGAVSNEVTIRIT